MCGEDEVGVNWGTHVARRGENQDGWHGYQK